MPKRRVYQGNKKGVYTRQAKPLLQGAAQSSMLPLAVVQYFSNWDKYSKMAHDYLSALYTLMSGNYVVIATVVFVVVLSFILPDITHKLQATQELKDVQKVLDKMSSEVKQAEVACLTVADQVCCLHCSMNDDTTETSKDLRDLSICASETMRKTQSEPTRSEKGLDFIRRVFFPNRNTSNKEVAIMSYVYTDSFNGEKKVTSSSQ